MARILALCAAFIFSGNIQAQNFGSDSVECAKAVDYYDDCMRIEDYDCAAKHMRTVLEICPEYGESIYTNANIIWEELIKVETDEVRKNELIDTLLNVIWNNRLKYYPSQSNYGRAAGQYLKYATAEPGRALDYYNYSLYPDEPDPYNVYGYFNAFYRVITQKLSTPGANRDDLDEIDEFKKQLLRDFFQYVDPIELGEDYYKGILRAMGKVYDCNYLEEYIAPLMYLDTMSAEMFDQFRLLMEGLGCTEGEAYLHLLEIKCSGGYTYDCTQSLGTNYLKKGEFNKALEYFETAHSLAETEEEKSGSLSNIIVTLFGLKDYEKCYKKASELVKTNPAVGYFYMARCVEMARLILEDDPFFQSLFFWVAYDLMELAYNAGNEDAKAYLAYCKSHFPCTNELFDYGLLDQDEYILEHWINQTTKVRPCED